MDKKFLTLVVVAFTGLFFMTVGVLTAADKATTKCADVPDEIVIQNKGYTKDKKGPVKFSHKKHHEDYKLACTACHHTFKDGKNVWKEGDPVKKCSQCHDPVKKQGKVSKLASAYHKNCKDCHKELAKAGKKTGPYKKCNKCHEKKKKS